MLRNLSVGEIAVGEVVAGEIVLEKLWLGKLCWRSCAGEIVLEKLFWGNDLTPIRHIPLFILHGRSFEISRKIPLSVNYPFINI